jgi:V8-like Glu-specific endopeptidase
MAVRLQNSDFQRLTRIISRLPSWRKTDGRISLIDAAYRGKARGDIIRVSIDYEGDALTTAVNTVAYLLDFGEVEPKEHALTLLLKYVLETTGGGESADFLNSIIDEIGRQVNSRTDSPIPSRPIDSWRGGDDDASVQEKIIGENTLRHLYLLMRGLRAARAVVHIALPTSRGNIHGTGFMIAPALLMTNNHVLADAEQAAKARFRFNYELNIDGRLDEQNIRIAAFKPGGIFYTNKPLDFTIVELEGAPPDFIPLTLRPTPICQVDDRVNIIQHPAGEAKQISMQNNRVQYADSAVVQYTTTTLPGSSGSPVMDDDFQVVAIHHSGGNLLEPGTDRRYNRNAGTAIKAVLDDLRAALPDLVTHLKVASV